MGANDMAEAARGGLNAHPVSSSDDNKKQLNSRVPAKEFFIFGYNISHSLSPTLHNAGFNEVGLPHHYQIHESEQVDASVAEIISRPDFGGASVTFPHKLQIGKLLDSVSAYAETIGAINTIVVRHEGGGKRSLHGDNTDWIGIKGCIQKSGIADLSSHGAALVLGAGGAARAACYAVQAMGMKDLVIVNRTVPKAEEMAAAFPGVRARVFSTLEEAAAAEGAAFRLIIGCVPADDLDEDKIPASLFAKSEDGVLVEMAYRPQVTGAMKIAGKKPGWKVYRGIDVLEEQAYAQFELWTEQKAPVEVMRSAMQGKIAAKV